MKKLITTTAILTIALFFNSKNLLASEKKPIIITTIKPIFSLAKAVVGSAGQVELLIKDNSSPHDFHLKPSHLKALEGSDIVFYIDENFENFLVNALKNIPQKKYALSKSAVDKVKARFAGVWQKNNYAAQYDFHFWLEVKNAKKIAEFIAEKLSENFPQNKKIYAENLAQLSKKLDLLEENLKTNLQGLENRAFLVAHDSYQYFENSHSLDFTGSITSDVDEFSSATRIKSLQKKIREEKIFCLFSEAQFSPKLAKTVIENSDVKMGILDPLGSNLPANENLYFDLMNNLSNDFKNCLKA